MSLFSKASYLKGASVTVYVKTETGKDAFNHPVYATVGETVDNVLIGSPSDQEILDVLNLTGRKVSYVLGIPKGDTHDWTDVKVTFFGKEFRTIGEPTEGLEGMIPLEWNKKVRCERINGQSGD